MIIWAPEAIADLTEIWDYISADNPRAAAKTAESIRQKAEYLSRFPRLGRPGRSGNSRHLNVVGTPYFIVYRITGSNIEIARVIHGAQNWPPGK
jgi:toxin ParE1/3/4